MSNILKLLFRRRLKRLSCHWEENLLILWNQPIITKADVVTSLHGNKVLPLVVKRMLLPRATRSCYEAVCRCQEAQVSSFPPFNMLLVYLWRHKAVNTKKLLRTDGSVIVRLPTYFLNFEHKQFMSFSINNLFSRKSFVTIVKFKI